MFADLDRHLCLLRRPEPKVRAVLLEKRRAKWQIAYEGGHGSHGRSTLFVRTALRTTTLISAPLMSRSPMSGCAVSISNRVGTFWVGNRNTRSWSLGFRNSVMTGAVPSSFFEARRTA